MSLLWRYGGAAVILVVGMGSFVFVAGSDLSGGAAMAVVVGVTGLAIVLVEGVKRWAWDGTKDWCVKCGEEIPGHRHVCEDCENYNPGGGA